MDDFPDDFDAGKIQFRDKWQFELKSDLFPLSYHGNNIINQEFYFFLPNSLQINEDTYSINQFYRDQTNLIRLKTPRFSFKQLIDLDYAESPLVRIKMLSEYTKTAHIESSILDEVKLLGNIIHSGIRDQITEFISLLDSFSKIEINQFSKNAYQFCDEIEIFCERFKTVKENCLNSWKSTEMEWTFNYINEFIGLSINDYFLTLLSKIREKKSINFKNLDERLCKIISLQEKEHLQKIKGNETITTGSQHDEYILYRKALLSKFVIDPLLLKIRRTSFSQRYRNIIGAIPAGIAMLVYLLIMVTWQGSANILLVNSQSLILLSVIIYILKDRIKEELKNISHQKAAKWFSDYTTEIKSHDDRAVLGVLRESFSFINTNSLPREVTEMRDQQFHSVLELFKRPEKIIYYKKVVNIQKKQKTMESRFYGLNIIFRFDIHHFLFKAEDPLHTYLTLDEALKLQKIKLPRVYHINIILKSTTILPNGEDKVMWDKYRLIVDKLGIKRIEEI
jgi:hypothetical protein